MTDRGHGGQRQPTRPAAVSGPGALSRRTDGGAGQPVRVPSGGAYGERKAATEQQQAAPMAAGGPSAPVGAGGGSPMPPASGGAFGPTQRPNESNTAGASQAQDVLARDPQVALRVLYAKFPHPSIARLIDWSASGGQGQQ